MLQYFPWFNLDAIIHTESENVNNFGTNIHYFHLVNNPYIFWYFLVSFFTKKVNLLAILQTNGMCSSQLQFDNKDMPHYVNVYEI